MPKQDNCPEFDYLLILPHLRVQNANAISSPQTHGFPSITAFMGLMWALERKTNAIGLDLQFNAVGVVAHKHQEQIAQTGWVGSFALTRNPIGKDSKTSAIVEEGRIHLELSLIFAVRSEVLHDTEVAQQTTDQVYQLVSGMRIAGGSVLPRLDNHRRDNPYILHDDKDTGEVFAKLKMRLLPGFTLVERPDVLDARFKALSQREPESTRLDAWLSASRINWCWTDETENIAAEWKHDRRDLGWLVPIPLGYGAISDLQPAGTVKRARDNETPFRFVESLYGLGEWISPHRLNRTTQLLWYADSRPDEGLYRCRNDYRPATEYTTN